MLSLLIIGSGAHGRIVAEAAVASGDFKVIGFGDDDPSKDGRSLDGYPVMKNWRETEADQFVVAIGKNEFRRKIFEELQGSGRRLATIISRRASVSKLADVGEGTVVLAGAVIQAGAKIGKNAIVNAGAVIDHDAQIEDHAHVVPGEVIRSYATKKS